MFFNLIWLEIRKEIDFYLQIIFLTFPYFNNLGMKYYIKYSLLLYIRLVINIKIFYVLDELLVIYRLFFERKIKVKLYHLRSKKFQIPHTIKTLKYNSSNLIFRLLWKALKIFLIFLIFLIHIRKTSFLVFELWAKKILIFIFV